MMLCLDETISETLYVILYPDEEYKGISIMVDGSDVADLESNLQGLLHSEWIENLVTMRNTSRTNFILQCR